MDQEIFALEPSRTEHASSRSGYFIQSPAIGSNCKEHQCDRNDTNVDTIVFNIATVGFILQNKSGLLQGLRTGAIYNASSDLEFELEPQEFSPSTLSPLAGKADSAVPFAENAIGAYAVGPPRWVPLACSLPGCTAPAAVKEQMRRAPSMQPTLAPSAAPRVAPSAAPSVPPSAAPTKPVECSNEAPSWMINSGKNCTSNMDWSQFCSNNKWWSKPGNKFCQKTCWQSGHGYQDDTCACSNEAPQWMANARKDCDSNLTNWARLCRNAAYWSKNSFCQKACWRRGYAYEGDDCRTPCTNEAPPWMLSQGKDCNSDMPWQKLCSTRAYWRTHQFCQKRCWQEGYGYEGDSCWEPR